MPKTKNLSQDPKQIRNRLRRKADRYSADLELYIDKAYGKPMSEWDLEELARGRPRAKNGTFAGLTPKWITPAIQKEAKRRLLDHTYGNLAGHVDLAVQTMVQLLKSTKTDFNGKPIVDARTKLEAAKFIVEHVIGKPKALVEVDATDMVKQFLAQALILDDGEQAHPVVDGQFYDNDEEEDDGDPE